MDLLFDSDDDSDYQSPADELTFEEREMLENSYRLSGSGLGRLLDDSSSSDDDSPMVPMELAETTG